MPKFKSTLRRQANVRKEPYKKRCHRESQPKVSTTRDPRPLDLRIAEINLANADVQEVSVGCWLDTKKLKWGRYDNQDTAILHLTIEANHPSNVEVGEFRIDLAFSSHQQPSKSPLTEQTLPTIPAPTEQAAGPLQQSHTLEQTRTSHADQTAPDTPLVPAPTSQNPTSVATPEAIHPVPSTCQREIELHGKPAPFTVFRNQQSPWNFSGHRIAAQSGRASTARWIWSAQQPKCSVTHCGGLYCGCIIKHGGPGKPISIMYRVEGEARENKDSDVARRYTFSSLPQNSFPWLLMPGTAVHELTDDEVGKLNDEVLRMYGVGVGKIEQGMNQVGHRPRYEGNVDGHGMLVQGDVHFGGTYHGPAMH